MADDDLPRPVEVLHDNSRRVLRDLQQMYPALPELRLKPSHRRISYIAHGWYMRTHRGCDAVMLLRDDGFAAEAWPIRRSVLEHVVALKWLAAEGGHIADVVRRAHGLHAQGRRDALVKAGWSSVDLDIFDVVIADVTDEHKHLDVYSQFTKRCEDYGSRDDMATYKIETAHSHPSWETAAVYLAESDDGDGVPLSDPEPDGRDDAAFCAQYLWAALAALGRMMERSPWEQALDDFHERIVRLATR